MDKWRIFGTGVVAAVCCVAVVACDPDGSGVVTDTPVATVTETTPATASPGAGADPTPTGSAWLLTQLPADALTNDLEGATKTAEFFLELYAPMFQTGQTNLWQALSGPDCGYCADALANAQEVQVRGWTAEGGEITATPDPGQSHLGDDGRAYVYLPSHLNEAVLVHNDGTREISEVASDHVFIALLERIDGVWMVQGVKFSED